MTEALFSWLEAVTLRGISEDALGLLVDKTEFGVLEQDLKGIEVETDRTLRCIRVVLPTDELIRVECMATMTVADILKMLGKRSNLREIKGVERNGDSGRNPLEDNNHDTDPATETSLECRSKGILPKSIRGKLVLVRQEAELDPESLLLDEVEELDILEFQLVDLNASGGTPERMCQNSCRRTSQILSSSPQNIVEQARPVPTTLIPLWRVKQEKRWDERAASQSLTEGAESRNLEPIKGHSEVREADLVQKSRAGWFTLRRRRARKHPTSRIKRKYLLSTGFQERRQATKVRKTAERILFQAGMQLIECTQFLQNAVRKLVFLLRDTILGNSNLNFGELLAILRTMVKTLTHTRLNSGPMTSSTTTDADGILVRRLSWDIAGKDGGVTILIEDWVVTAEWGTFWRTQRKEYACLCDNHMLYFFTNRTQCADFIFELGRERNGNASDISKRILKDNSPLSRIDLSETDWSVRKSTQLEEGSHEAHRNAFAFFDSNGSMKLVLDVNTADEATTWTRLIAAEISRNKLFSRMRELNEHQQEPKPEGDTSKSNPLHTWTKIMTHSSAEQHSLIIPLRALYSQIDRVSGTARAERYKSWTLNQALKDLQRDRVKINGLLLSGASLETNILTLALEILKCTDDISAKTTHGESTPFVTMAAKEMTALRFARQVIICSSRTHGGGDILDTLHLLFGHERVCICPDAQSMEPVEIEISQTHGATTTQTLCARITMRMTYRVIPSDSIGPMDGLIISNGYSGGDASDPRVAESQSVQNGDMEQFVAKEFKVLGTYTQTLTCHLIETNDIDGTVQLQFVGYDYSPEQKEL